MPRIELRTYINAKQQVVFDLSRSVTLHKISTAHTNETAIAGRTEGLMELNESVTRRARHFGMYQTLTSKITAFDPPIFFVDEMIEGTFKSFRHEHHFTTAEDRTLMTDYFDYTSPWGILGKLADFLFLKRYMRGLLEKRNESIKEFAEFGKWKSITGQY
ncbi:MAG: SRPBCC family protein [Bacteroidota bacterium]